MTFDVPKLWHASIAVEIGEKSSVKSDATVPIKRKKVQPNLVVLGIGIFSFFSLFSSGLFNKTVHAFTI